MLNVLVKRGFFALLMAGVLVVGTPVQAATPEPGPSYVDINGAPVSFDDYKGKWIVVNYWATWCPPCQEEIPELIHFHENHKDTDAVVIGFNMEKANPAALSRFVEENMMSYPVIPMSDDMVLMGNIPGLPTTYLIDPSGKPVAMQVGEVTTEMLETYINNSTAK
ncbi:MAG: TlpA disulfide reductase family protein [Candidatus Thiodiazotropha sp.]